MFSWYENIFTTKLKLVSVVSTTFVQVTYKLFLNCVYNPFSLAKKVEGTKIAPNTTFRSFQIHQIKVNLRFNIATDEPSLKKPKKVWFF